MVLVMAIEQNFNGDDDDDCLSMWKMRWCITGDGLDEDCCDSDDDWYGDGDCDCNSDDDCDRVVDGDCDGHGV